MKKSLKVIASATLAFSMFASVAMAAETTSTTTTTPAATTTATTVKTSKDFTDLKDVDAALAAKIDVLLSKGYMEGKTDTSFDVTGNMTRAEAAKLVAKVLGLTVDANAKTSFSDVDATDGSINWAIPFIEAAKAKGVIDGMTDTTFAPKENVTLGQLATMFVKALGKTADVKTTTPWFQGYLDVAKANGIDLGTDGAKAATRADLVVGSYNADVAYQNINKPAQVSVASAKAAGAKKVEVALDRDVDTTKATFSLKKGTVSVATTVAYSDDKKTATLTLTDTKLSAGDYTVTLGGLDASAIKTATGTFTAENEKVTKIDFVNASETIAYDSKVVLKVKASNQYGENAQATAGAYNVVASGAVVINTKKADDGTLLVTLDTEKNAQSVGIATINIMNTDSYVSTSKSFKIGTVPIITKLELGDLKYTNTANTISGTGENATFDLNIYDQYGSLIAYDSKVFLANAPRLVWSQYEPALQYEVKQSDANVPQIKITLSSNVEKTGEYTFTVYDQAALATGKVSVTSAKVATKVELGDVSNVIAAGDDEAYIPVIAYDAAGNQLSVSDLVSDTNATRISYSVSGATLAAAGYKVDAKDAYIVRSGDHKGQIKITGISSTAKGIVSVTALIGTANANSVATKTYTIADVRVPDHFKVVTDPAVKAVKGASTSFDIEVIDQYGAKLDKLRGTDGNGNAGTAVVYDVTVTNTTYGNSIVLSNDKGTTDDGYKAYNANDTIPFTAAGSKTFNGGWKYSVASGAANDDNAQFKAVINKTTVSDSKVTEVSSLTKKLSVAKDSESLNYSVNAVANLYAQIDSGYAVDGDQKDPVKSAFANEVKIAAKDAAGNVVALPKQITAITTSNPNVVKVGLGLASDNKTANGKAYVLGNKAGTATINVTFATNDGTQKQAFIDVTTKTDAVQVTGLTVGNSEADIIGSGANNAFVVMNLKTSDNYGHGFENTAAKTNNYLYGVTFTATSIIGTGKVSIDTDGNITVTGTVTSFDLTAVAPNGKSVSTAITVK